MAEDDKKFTVKTVFIDAKEKDQATSGLTEREANDLARGILTIGYSYIVKKGTKHFYPASSIKKVTVHEDK